MNVEKPNPYIHWRGGIHIHLGVFMNAASPTRASCRGLLQRGGITSALISRCSALLSPLRVARQGHPPHSGTPRPTLACHRCHPPRRTPSPPPSPAAPCRSPFSAAPGPDGQERGPSLAGPRQGAGTAGRRQATPPSLATGLPELAVFPSVLCRMKDEG
jgi:hypothetical protein